MSSPSTFLNGVKKIGRGSKRPSDPIVQRPENAVFRQIARARWAADWLWDQA
jgi:hypothetical protein